MTASRKPLRPHVTRMEWALMLALSGTMIGLSWFQIWPLGLTDVLGFATGGICVWLVVREHIANWPLGMANNLVFLVLFYETRLYADMTLQVLYFGLGVFGWWEWLRGGPQRQALTLSLTRRVEWLGLIPFIPLATWLMYLVLVRLHDAAPFWDSVTTVLSLAAQYLLCVKRLENWFFWIAADLIYVPLYFSRDLPLTAVLYGLFLVMCLYGLSQWRKKWKQLQAE